MFNNTKLLTLMAAGLVLFACQKERADLDALVTSDDQLTFTAAIDGAETRTSLDGTKIVWNAGEEINIFYGASEGSRFVSTNTEPSQMVTFTGTLSAFTGTTGDGEPNSFWAIYPYDESNVSSGTSVTAYLPEQQSGVKDNIPDKTLMMLAKTPGLALSFKQVCARLKVVVSTPGIKKIEISGDADETIAGRISVSMNSQGVPEWQAVETGGEKVIELTPASGTTFELGDYYVVLLPQAFESGFTMTCYKDNETGSYSTAAVTFERNQIKTVNTNKVTEWTVEQPNNVIYYTSSDGAVVAPYNPDAFGASIVSNEYVDGRGIITFDGDVTSIGGSAFQARSTLTSVNIPKSVTSIANDAFYKCSGLTGDLVLPEGLTSIGNSAFNGCSGLTGNLVLPEGLTSIGESAFSGCSGLTGNLVLPEGLTSIGSSAFSNCRGFTGDLVLPEGVTSIGSNAFFACYGFTGLVLPEGLTSIGMFAFCRCIGFTGSLILPEGLTSIGNSAFADCSGFTGRLVLPEGLTSISDYAFFGCSGLSDITVLPMTPPSGASSMFNNTNDVPIRVPARSVGAYKSAEYWSDYADRIYAIGSPVAVDLGLPSGLKWASFNLGATRPEEYGDYYAWGEIEPYYSSQDPLTWKEGKEAGYAWVSYMWCMGSWSTMTKYCSYSDYGYNGFTDNKIVLDLEDDAAYVNLGGNWRMPTNDEFTELRENCTWEWTQVNGINGGKFTGPNGNSIFLPAAGIRNATVLNYAGSVGQYWSSSLKTDNYPYNAYGLNFNSGSHAAVYVDYRYYGYSVRPVYAE